jgi:uncharacterized phiE125 gp8 family phage protein
MSNEIVTAPSSYPITLTEAKAHLNIPDTDTDHDTYIRALIRSATAKAEQFLHRRLVTQTWKYYLDNWPSGLFFELPFGRLQSVTSIKYKDEDGTESTMAATEYIVDTQSEPGIVELGYEESWPSGTLYPNNPIKTEFVCGYYIGATWVKETAYVLNDQVMPVTENGLVYKCTTALTSSATEPTWPLTIDETVADGAGGTAGVWTCLGMAVPDMIRDAIKVAISDRYENRESEYFGMTVSKLNTFIDLLFPHRLWG